MNVDVNWVAVVLAVVAKMVVGMVWYARSVFGDTWAKLAGLKDEDMKAGSGKAIGLGLVSGLATAYVLAHVSFLSNAFFTDNSFLQNALTTAFFMWFGFAAAVLITHNSFELKPTKLTMLGIGNELVTFMAMGLVIGILKP